MKFQSLLIDDKIQLGWGSVMTNFLSKEFDCKNHSVSTIEEAELALETNKYDIIFLDLRLQDSDNNISDSKELSSYKLVELNIRGRLENLNFATPVFIFTASNKIWHISHFIDVGADGFYIKESPDVFNRSDSKQKFDLFKSDIKSLLSIGSEKQKFVTVVKRLLAQETKSNKYIRLKEKLLITYKMFFDESTSFELDILKDQPKTLAYITLYSCLEEFIKSKFIGNWNTEGDKMQDGNYAFENSDGVYLIENNTEGSVKKNTLRGNIMKAITYNIETGNYDKISKNMVFEQGGNGKLNSAEKKFLSSVTGRIKLNTLLYGYLLLIKNWKPDRISSSWRHLRDYRNKSDFIHPNPLKAQKPLNSGVESTKHFWDLVDFINEILV